MEGSSTDVSAGADGDRGFRFDTPSYERLLRQVQDAGRSFVGFDEPEAGVVLQHDVELSLDRALTMARLEATLRVCGTYCVPLDAPLHDTSTVTFANTVQTISQLGHEVGLQFDPHAHWAEPPGEDALRRRIDERRDVLARLVGEPVEVVSFRQPTERLRSFDLEGAINACQVPPDLPEYRTVSDREWLDGLPLRDGVPERFRLCVHPGLWHSVERGRPEVLADYRRAAHEQVDHYFDAFSTSPSVD